MGCRIHDTRDLSMVDHSYRVRLTTQTVQHVIASTVQLYGDHWVFVNSNGQLTALFLKSLVRSRNMLPKVLPDNTGLRHCSGTKPMAYSRLRDHQMALWLRCSTRSWSAGLKLHPRVHGIPSSPGYRDLNFGVP